ncbi:MAG: phosphatase PAP2 family protein [Planctomycetaceae bacterium]|nr:phosphatase PAP2 family protein [Planctomycetaceae bacterium]
MHSKTQSRTILLTAVTCLIAFALFEGIRKVAGTPDHDPDAYILNLLRNPEQPTRMIGPPALEEAMRDFTALGGYAVLLTAIAFAGLFLRFRKGRSDLRFLLFSCIAAYGAGMTLKSLIGRQRPSVVEHLSHVSSLSFPSVHSMMSAVVFLSIGLLLSELTSDRRIRTLLLVFPLLLTLLVGFSRVCMGVHYPTDVLAGWGAGLGWTWAAFRVRGSREES